MKISELIERLQELKVEHGDLEVCTHDQAYAVDKEIDFVKKEGKHFPKIMIS